MLKDIKSILLALVMLAGITAAQINRSGNLVKVKFTDTHALQNDTLAHWFYNDGQYGYENYIYYGHLRLPLHNYLLKKHFYIWDSNVFQTYQGLNTIEYDTSWNERHERLLQILPIAWDVITPYLYVNTQIINTPKGTLIIDGVTGNSFINNYDSLFNNVDIIHNRENPISPLIGKLLYIIGEILNKSLGVFARENRYGNNYDFRLVDLSDPSVIDSQSTKSISFIGNGVLEKIKWLDKDIYVGKYPGIRELKLFHYYSDTIRFIKTLPSITVDTRNFEGSARFRSENWNFRNNYLYVLKESDLSRYEFSSKDSSFINKKVLVDSLTEDNSNIDPQFKFLSRILNGKLDIYDIDKAEYINRINLEGIKNPSMPFIDSPYVFIHQQNYFYTSVDNNNEKTVVDSYRLSAYPNPFNASAKIFYSLPEDKFVEINVFDIIGRKITCLVKGSIKKGDHEILFDASSLPSGIYFYSMTTDNCNKTGKLVLMK